DGIRDRNVTGVQTCALPICGKVVLASGAPQPVQQVAVAKRGAAGSITWGLNDSYFPGKDDAYPDLVGWQVLNPRKVDGFEPTFKIGRASCRERVEISVTDGG